VTAAAILTYSRCSRLQGLPIAVFFTPLDVTGQLKVPLQIAQQHLLVRFRNFLKENALLMLIVCCTCRRLRQAVSFAAMTPSTDYDFI
jgi:hypothetical protein